MSIQIQEDFPFVIVSFCSGDRRNLLTICAMEELCSALKKYETDDRCQVVILTGNEEYFCFGGDLGDPAKRTVEDIAAFSSALCGIHRVLAGYPKITIAAASGKTGGGGVSLVDACDLAVVSRDATFEFPELLNRSAPMISLMGVRNSLPKKLCYEMMLAKPIPAARLLELGMVNRIAESEPVVEAAKQFWREIPPCNLNALSLCKQYYMATQGVDYSCQLELGRHYLTSLLFGA